LHSGILIKIDEISSCKDENSFHRVSIPGMRGVFVRIVKVDLGILGNIYKIPGKIASVSGLGL
jgi:hypothetical protein